MYSSFFGVTDITAFILGTIFIVLLPGPNSLFVLTVAAKRGYKMGALGACGIFVGDGILMILTALGAASMLNTHPVLYYLMKFGGAAYLSWIGLQLLIGAYKKWISHKKPHIIEEDIQTEANIEQESLPHPFYRALVISLLNPKAIFFFLSFFVQFIDKSYPNPMLPFLIQATIVQLCSAAYLTTLILSGTKLANAFRQRQRLSAALNALVGCLFCGYGIRLATTGLIK